LKTADAYAEMKKAALNKEDAEAILDMAELLVRSCIVIINITFNTHLLTASPSTASPTCFATEPSPICTHCYKSNSGQ
jgi:hypothetical protein